MAARARRTIPASSEGSGLEVPAAPLTELARELDRCRACPLYARATQAVPGVGGRSAPIVLVGEQPGDQEDRQGIPFVGPAGRVLERAIEASGLEPDELYVTNAVKHFKWEARGTRRLHKKPSRAEVVACRPWLERELDLVSPRVVVALGATSGSSLVGPAFRVGTWRGHPVEVEVGLWSGPLIATIHPSAVLRAPTDAERRRLEEGLVSDLRVAGELRRALG